MRRRPVTAMKMCVREVMNPDPISLAATASTIEAARAMRDADIGALVVMEGDQVYGIVTDRDIVLRVLAEARDPGGTLLQEICNREVTTLSPHDSMDEAVRLMQEKAIRRLPVVENQRLVGIVSIGDVAPKKDPYSALSSISAGPPNR